MRIEVLQPDMHVIDEKAQSLTPHMGQGSKRTNKRHLKNEPVLSESGRNKRRRNVKTSQKMLVHLTQSSL